MWLFVDGYCLDIKGGEDGNFIWVNFLGSCYYFLVFCKVGFYFGDVVVFFGCYYGNLVVIFIMGFFDYNYFVGFVGNVGFGYDLDSLVWLKLFVKDGFGGYFGYYFKVVWKVVVVFC